MYKSIMDDSVTYFSNDIPTNFVRTSHKGVQKKDKSIFEPSNTLFGSGDSRVDTAYVDRDRKRFKATFQQSMNSKYGRTAYGKKRNYQLTDSLNQDSLMDETTDTGFVTKDSAPQTATRHLLHSGGHQSVSSKFTLPQTSREKCLPDMHFESEEQAISCRNT